MLDKFKNDFKYNFKWAENLNISQCVLGVATCLGLFTSFQIVYWLGIFTYICVQEK